MWIPHLETSDLLAGRHVEEAELMPFAVRAEHVRVDRPIEVRDRGGVAEAAGHLPDRATGTSRTSHRRATIIVSIGDGLAAQRRA